MASATPGMFSKCEGSTAVWLPVMPMAVRVAPGIGWGLYPSSSMTRKTVSICASVASDFITISMLVLYSHNSEKVQRSASSVNKFLEAAVTRAYILSGTVIPSVASAVVNWRRAMSAAAIKTAFFVASSSAMIRCR